MTHFIHGLLEKANYLYGVKSSQYKATTRRELCATYRFVDTRFKCERPQLHIICTTGLSVFPYEESE